MNVFEKLEMIKDEAKQLINDSSTIEDLKQLKVKYLGKKGPIQEAMALMRDLPDEEKPKVGQLANQIKQLITDFLNTQMATVEANLMALELEKAKIDITLPGRSMKEGYHHPLSLIIEEIEDLFIAMEYQVVEGPELETDYYNFELLNLPQDHPARDMQDTFYIDMKHLLRTHTSPVQARTMQSLEEKQPIRIICPGKTYRRDDDDATHSHQFTQVEGLVIDKDITMADLKGTLDYFVKAMFGQKREIRFRPSYFPFTEPSVEVDISCAHCQGKGCSTCKQTGWIEVLGAGMVHPNVLLMGGFDPEVYQGFAFGIGIERIAMLRYGIDNIRHFYTNDLRFLKQF